MSDAIYRLDDGSVYHFDADTPAAAREQWIALLMEDGYTREQVIEEFGEPDIRRTQLVEAARIKVVGDGPMIECPTCGGHGEIEKPRSLLEIWQENQKLPPGRRAKHGALCNSEWP